MTPGTATGDAARAILRTGWISLGRFCVIIFTVPIRTPFVHVVSHIEQLVAVWPPLSDSLRSFPFPSKVINLSGRLASPGIFRIFEAAAARLLPLGLGGQAEGFAQ